MSRNDEMKKVLEKSLIKFSDSHKLLLLLLTFFGVVFFFVTLSVTDPYVAWQAFLINTIYFTGIAHAALMYSVIFTITDAYWGRCMKRIAEALAAFVPIGIVFFFILFLGGKYFFEWYDHDRVIHTKEGWLNYSFFIQRNAVSMILVGALSYFYVKNSLRPDIGYSRTLIPGIFNNGIANHFTKNYSDDDKEVDKGYFSNIKLAPILGMSYALLSSLIAFDWMMSIDQEWFSTMFGVQHLVSNLLGAGAVLIIVLGIIRKRFNLEDYITLDRYHDICKLTFALGLLWTYMIFSQVLIIWYANLPEETPYLMLRLKSKEWSQLFWFIFFVLFQIPFWGLMSRTACRSVGFSRIIAIDILIGVWLERYIVVAPSILENNFAAGAGGHGESTGTIASFQFTSMIPDLCIGLGMLGLFLYAFLYVLEKVPMMPISDHRLFSSEEH